MELPFADKVERLPRQVDGLPAGLRVGSCSWKYDSWRGLVYSDERALNHLGEYALTYGSVEVDLPKEPLRAVGTESVLPVG